MNVYDFDKTIYDGDSSVDFYKYCLKNQLGLMKHWPKQTKAMFDYKRGKITKTEMKTIFYEYMADIDNLNKVIADFWNENRKKLKPWYLEQRRDDDVIVSASPEFFLKPICDELNIHLIGSVVDPRNGKNLRPNCYGAEKVKRFEEKFDLKDMEEFYSDSYSDDPLAQYATKSFLVKGNDLLDW